MRFGNETHMLHIASIRLDFMRPSLFFSLHPQLLFSLEQIWISFIATWLGMSVVEKFSVIDRVCDEGAILE